MTPRRPAVFYDSKGRRFQYSRRFAIAFMVFILTIFSILVTSLLIRPTFPVLSLTTPEDAYRNAPNVAKNSALAAPQGFTLKNFSLLGAQKTATRTQALGFYVNWDDNSLVSLKQNIGSLDVLVPEWLHLSDQNGGIVVDDADRQAQTLDYIKSARADLPITPLINNYDSEGQDWDGARLAGMLADSHARRQNIENILSYVEENHFSGVSIDYENVPDTSQAALGLYMSELYARFHPLGLQVSQNIPLDDDSYDAKALGQSADYLILMGYDEHSIDDTPAGPVASVGWLSQALSARFAELPASKYVVALGAYGYDWQDNSINGSEMTFQDAVHRAALSNATVTLDKNALNPTFDYYDDKNALHHVWFLDAVSTYDQMRAVSELGNVAGYALWRLGSEDPSLWRVIQARDHPEQVTAASLQELDYGYDISYDGMGEVLRVSDTPKTGSRDVTFDANTSLITAEKITGYPSTFVITRWGNAGQKKIALTFDDGPDPKYTPQILDILKKEQVPGTFFVIGANANMHPDLLQRMASWGNEVGNHTYTHPDISHISTEQFQLEVASTERLFESILGRKSLLFRPPYAEDIEPSTPDQILPLELADMYGYYTVAMHIDPNDWSRPGTNQIVERVIQGAQNRDDHIVLLHDGGGDRSQTVAALPQIIDTLKSQGYQFVSVSDLLGLPMESVMPPVSGPQRLLARVNAWGFFILTGMGQTLALLFLLGIVLGILRFLFIAVLAILQYIVSRFGRYKRFLHGLRPSVSVVIPAHNEERVIVRTVESILRSTYPLQDIIVVDDGSTDDTFELARRSFEHNDRVQVFHKQNGGKASALNFGIERSVGDIIVTLDADTQFLPDTIAMLLRRFADRRVAAVAGNTKVGNRVNLLTRWQALEYITSQNLDRRAFEFINCITVVPGAVGAWRRRVLSEAGGFSDRTMAEDADLTFSILRLGHAIAYEDKALAYTEAPDTVRGFITQRFRWMYGMLQTAWKHRDTLFRPRYRGLGFFSVPNVFIFQIFFPLISPFMDLMMVGTILWSFWQKFHHPDFSLAENLSHFFLFYGLFLLIDFLTAMVPFFLERREQWSLLLWLPLQRFYYRQLMYYVAIKAVAVAIQGRLTRWGKAKRKATVHLLPSIQRAGAE